MSCARRSIIAIWNALLPLCCISQVSFNCDSIYAADSVLTRRTFIFYETMPALKSDVSCLSEAHDKGRVVVQLVVDTLGLPRCPKVISSDNHDLDQIALECAKRLAFTPASNEGKRVARVYRLPMVFEE